jgi:hypothetical protein
VLHTRGIHIQAWMTFVSAAETAVTSGEGVLILRKTHGSATSPDDMNE